jgi:hypothetical protein
MVFELTFSLSSRNVKQLVAMERSEKWSDNEKWSEKWCWRKQILLDHFDTQIRQDDVAPSNYYRTQDVQMDEKTMKNMFFKEYSKDSCSALEQARFFEEHCQKVKKLHNDRVEEKIWRLGYEKSDQYKIKYKAALCIQKHCRGILIRNHFGVHNPHCEIGKQFINRMYQLCLRRSNY